jgi:hypothetical protein
MHLEKLSQFIIHFTIFYFYSEKQTVIITDLENLQHTLIFTILTGTSSVFHYSESKWTLTFFFHTHF